MHVRSSPNWLCLQILNVPNVCWPLSAKHHSLLMQRLNQDPLCQPSSFVVLWLPSTSSLLASKVEQLGVDGLPKKT